MSNYIVSDTSLGSVADAIRTKGGTSAPLEYPQGFIDAIDDIQTGGGAPTIQSLTVTENGTYTAPSGVDGYSPVTVNVSSGGDTPIPDDGKTRIFIHITDGTPDNRLTFYLGFTASRSNNTTVDWGDGTVEVLGEVNAYSYPHKYPSGGDYIITMTVNTGTIWFGGSDSARIYGSSNNSNAYNWYRVNKLIVGNNVTKFESSACQTCHALYSVTLSNSVTTLGYQAFGSCQSLTSITIPSSVTKIESSAFAYARGMSEIHLKRYVPPTLANSDAFNSIPSDCVIYVPYSEDHSILDAYKTATNWSTYASKMQEEPT